MDCMFTYAYINRAYETLGVAMNAVTRKPRSRNVIPSARRRRELYQMLDQLADKGDVDAAGWLLLLAEQRESRLQSN